MDAVNRDNLPPKTLAQQIRLRARPVAPNQSLAHAGASPSNTPQPPLSPTFQVTPGPHAPDSTALSPHTQGGLSPDAMQVLEAFQKALEWERARTRNKMLTLAVVPTLCILVAVGSFIAWSLFLLNHVKETAASVKVSVAKLADLPAIPDRTPPVSAPEQPANSAGAQPEGATNSTIGEIQQALRTLEIQNSGMQESMRSLMSELKKPDPTTPPPVPDPTLTAELRPAWTSSSIQWRFAISESPIAARP